MGLLLHGYRRAGAPGERAPRTRAQPGGSATTRSAGLRNGTLRPVIGQELPLARPRAHEAVMEPGHHGKVVLIP
jgi:NADPH:quinone reductase-like Zn-dependent oxidoreductase